LLIGVATARAAQMTAADFVSKAAAGDLYEQRSSKLVLASTKNPKIRSFAQTMISDHGKTTAEVKAAALKAGMKPKSPMLDQEKSKMIHDLTAARGEARDKLYVQQQKAAHQEALALHHSYSASGDKAPLKAAATKAVPIVEHHIEMLNAM
jgi:putative membrane protein